MKISPPPQVQAKMCAIQEQADNRMKITRKLVPEMTIAEFAVKHDLEMVVNERSSNRSPRLERFYASFKGVESKDGGILCGNFGNGDTEEEAIADYAKDISEKPLVVDAYSDKRREIQAPRFI